MASREVPRVDGVGVRVIQCGVRILRDCYIYGPRAADSCWYDVKVLGLVRIHVISLVPLLR